MLLLSKSGFVMQVARLNLRHTLRCILCK